VTAITAEHHLQVAPAAASPPGRGFRRLLAPGYVRCLPLEWQVSSPPPVFNFDASYE